MPKNLAQIIADAAFQNYPGYGGSDYKPTKPVKHNPQTDELVNPEAGALEDSLLDPLNVIGGGAIVKGVHKNVQKYGEYLMDAKLNRAIGKKPDMQKRVGNVALGSAFAKMADPTIIPRALGDMAGFGVSNVGIGGAATGMANLTSKFAVDVARLKNFRLNKIAGASNEQAVALDKIATTSLKLGTGNKYKGKIDRVSRMKKDGLNADVGDVYKSAFDLVGM